MKKIKSIKDVIKEREAAWNLYLTCGKHSLVKTFTSNELEEDDDTL